MVRELITSWSDYQAAIDLLLPMACNKIRIYDEDLGHLMLDAAPRLAQLKRILHSGQRDTLQIALRNATPLRQLHPHLLNLLSTYGHAASALQTPEQLGHLRDSMIIVDDRHALVRFEQGQARSKLLLDAPEEVKPYIVRFAEIYGEGGEQISGSTLGL